MYFSLITSTPGQERQATREWWDCVRKRAEPYREHQLLWRFFPAPDGSKRDFLFRREDTQSLPRFYVVSERPASSPGMAWSVRTQPYQPKLQAGDCLRFILRANPVIAVRRDGKSIRHDVVMHEKKRLLAEKGVRKWSDLPENERPLSYELVRQTCQTWLEKRAVEKGFAFDAHAENFAVDAYQPLRLDTADKKNNDRGIRFTSVDFSGILTVTDPERFQKALVEGIGPAKAFGCGLLLVRPL
ncbi:MAG: type I-E CRISPR-associated protein Cas6/Cse3/CasE [Azoarcus sp.]|jgi:CRISPR system Cascade subunit CasE|nr:type I-E CRISPR-associated protein Cas6/Cse3/CasE [Azoarcus sp.]